MLGTTLAGAALGLWVGHHLAMRAAQAIIDKGGMASDHGVIVYFAGPFLAGWILAPLLGGLLSLLGSSYLILRRRALRRGAPRR